MDQEQTPQGNTTSGKKGKKLSLVTTVVIVLLLLGVGAYFLLGSDDNDATGQGGGNAVVATVDGVEITQQQVNERIERNRTALETQGTDLANAETRALIEEQIINQLVNEALIVAAATEAGIEVTEAEVDTEYANIQARFETPELFESELENNLFTEQSLRANIERELITQKYIDQMTADAEIEVTDEEVQTLYDQVAAQNDTVPPLEEVRDQVEGQIRNQKLAALIDQLISDLRADADIVIVASADDSAE